jgi:hypothetical protein
VRAEEWSAAGDPTDGLGFITYRQIPIHWWLLHRRLTYGHPHWGWWYRLWGRVLPYWGDPFCAAYTIVWSRFYESRQEDPATVEVGWDGLPKVLKAAIRSRRNEDVIAIEHPRTAVPDVKRAQLGVAGPL